MTTLRSIVLALALVTSFVACSTAVPSTQALVIDTAPAITAPPGGAIACAQANAGLVTISRDGGRLTFVSTTSNQPTALVWPHGFSARVDNGKGQLLDPSGAVVGTEGMTIGPLGGGVGSTDAFFVCSIGDHIYP